MDFDLKDLDDSVFQIHEEVITDEKQLFRLDNYLDTVLRSNTVAKTDGVFRVKLSADLRKKKSNWEDFWKMSEGSKKKVTVQFLTTSDSPEARYCMEHMTSQLPGSSFSFVKALNNTQTLENPSPTCCSEILQREGPKMAVKHFYDMLMSKCVVISKHSRAGKEKDISCKRVKFDERQRCLQEQDPSAICALVEQSMTSAEYKVIDQKNEHHVSAACECQNCYLNRQAEILNCTPKNVKADGDGENCALYLTDFEEDSKNFLYITPNFAMSHLCHLNMLTDLDSYYAGVSFPFLYVSGLHSFFGMHIEDMALPSINYMHMGREKLWVVVAPSEITKLSVVLSNYGLLNLHRVCLFKLSHKSYVVLPQLLIHHGIKFKIIIQEPGDFIFLAPNAAHTGGNMGVSLAEACNVGTVDWLPYGSVASTQNCNCLENKVHMEITPLFKIHCNDLLKYHINGMMAENFKDPHFKRSIIAVNCDEPLQRPSPVSIQASGSFTKKTTMTVKTERVPCPLKREGCFKTYQSPVKRETLMTHIRQEHNKYVTDVSILKAVDSLCCRKKICTGQRYECSDCGADISVNSSRHKGSKVCREKAAMVKSMSKNQSAKS